MEEALWNLEDKLKLSTQEALLLFVCTALVAIGICTATLLRKKTQKKQLSGEETAEMGSEWDEGRPGLVTMKTVLMGSVRWSRPNKWPDRPEPLLQTEARGVEVGWQSHNSASPVWQRPILMGEKCELPRFSGLILYDERGRPLHEPQVDATTHHEIPIAVERTTLKDLL